MACPALLHKGFRNASLRIRFSGISFPAIICKLRFLTSVFRLRHIRMADFSALLCLMVPGLLQAGTYYTYTGNPYPPSTGCGGAYVCNGTTPSLTITFFTTATQLANLTMGSTGVISASVTSWTVTDNAAVTITQASNSAQLTVNLTTDDTGKPTAWTVYATATANNGAGGSENGCTTTLANSCPGGAVGDQSTLNSPSSSLYANGSNTGTPGTWTVSSNPPLTINTSTVAFPGPNINYSQTLSVTGGAGGPYTWSTSPNSPPPGWLTLDSTGLLHGTPTAVGPVSFVAVASDVVGLPGPPQTITVEVNFGNTVITTNLPAGMAIVNISGVSSTPTVGGERRGGLL